MSRDCCGSGHGRKGHGHHGGHHKQGRKKCSCGCGHDRWRKFRTKDEIREELKEYKAELEKEIQAVEERLDEL